MLERRRTETWTWTDPRTGALSSAALDEALGAEIERSRRYGTPLSAVVLDSRGLDGPALLELAVAVRTTVRRSDVVGRDREGRLVILVPGADDDVARRIAAALASRSTTPVGAARWVADEQPASLLRRARPSAARRIA